MVMLKIMLPNDNHESFFSPLCCDLLMKMMPMGGGGEIIRGVGALGNREDHTTTEYHRMPHNVIRVYPALQYTWVYQGLQYTMYRYTGEYDTGIHGETARTTPRLRR